MRPNKSINKGLASEDEVDRQIRFTLIWLRRKAARATIGELATATLNVLLLFVGLAAAIIYGRQLTTMNRQLSEMQGSGQQTDQIISIYGKQLTQLIQQAAASSQLATAAGKQADAAGRQADASKTIAKATSTEAEAAKLAAQAAGRSAEEATKQLTFAQKQLETSQRAWLSVDKISALTFGYTVGSKGIVLAADVFFKNSGNLPATQIEVIPVLYIPKQGAGELDEVKLVQSLVCKAAREERNRKLSISQTAFPSVTKDYIVALKDQADRPGTLSDNGEMHPVIVGCVRYRFSSSESTHETGFIYELGRKGDNGVLIPALTYGNVIPANAIVFRDYWNGEATSVNP